MSEKTGLRSVDASRLEEEIASRMVRKSEDEQVMDEARAVLTTDPLTSAPEGAIVRAVRVVVFEGTKEWMVKQLAQSMPAGRRDITSANSITIVQGPVQMVREPQPVTRTSAALSEWSVDEDNDENNEFDPDWKMGDPPEPGMVPYAFLDDETTWLLSWRTLEDIQRIEAEADDGDASTVLGHAHTIPWPYGDRDNVEDGELMTLGFRTFTGTRSLQPKHDQKQETVSYALVRILSGRQHMRAYLSVPAPIPEDPKRSLDTSAVASWDIETTRLVATVSGSTYDLTGLAISILGGPRSGDVIDADQPIPWDQLGFTPHDGKRPGSDQP